MIPGVRGGVLEANMYHTVLHLLPLRFIHYIVATGIWSQTVEAQMNKPFEGVHRISRLRAAISLKKFEHQ